MKLFYPIIIALLFSSCIVSHNGSVSSGPLLNATDVYTDIAKGTSHSKFFLCLGKIDKTDLIQLAKKDLHFKRPIHQGEYYANFSTDINKKWIFFVFQSINVTVSADVMSSGNSTLSVLGTEFSKKITPFVTPNKPFPAKSPVNKKRNENLINGDSVYFSLDSKNYDLYEITSLDKESVILKSISSNRKNILVSVQNSFF